jgi:hypothetical protein
MSARLAALQREFLSGVFGEGEPATRGIAVYRASVLANYHGALAATYRVVSRLVGDAFFDEAARRFALAHASRSGDLADYGEGFADFLSGYEPATPLDYLADVARLEWACHECDRAPEAPAFDFAALARVPSECYAALRLTLHPATRLVASVHPIVAIREANAPGRDGTPSRIQGADFALVRRVDGHAHVQSVPSAEWHFLEALAGGESLGKAAASLAVQDAEAFLAQALSRYVASGIVCGFTAA